MSTPQMYDEGPALTKRLAAALYVTDERSLGLARVSALLADEGATYRKRLSAAITMSQAKGRSPV